MWEIRLMFRVCLLAVATSLSAFAGAADAFAPPPITCGNGVPGGINCLPSKKELKEARKAYARGLKLEEQNRFEEAFAAFDDASRLVPQDAQFFSAWEVAKSQLVFAHTERGDALLSKGQREQGAAEFRAALKLDPDDSYTQGRLTDALQNTAGREPAASMLLIDSTELHLQPSAAKATFHYLGDARGLFTQLAAAYGMSVEFDESVESAKQVRFYVDEVDFFTALNLACSVTKSMWSALDAKQFFVAKDSTENHKQFDRWSLATFSIPNAVTQQEATEMATSLRNICDFQKVSSGQLGILEVRAPQNILAACTQLLQELTSERPQVSIDLQIYQISHNFTRDIGLHVPNTFNLYNIPVAALAALGGQSIQSLVNQLISSGGINQAGSSALSGILAQLQGQSSGIFSQPLATFGGGLTFSGLSLDHFTTALSLNESWARSLSHATLRTGQGKEATFHIGERYPILNASYAPIYNSSQISQVLGNNSYVAPFPSVSYEDLGLNIKAATEVHGDNSVALKLELQVRSLTGASANGVPVIANQEYQGSISLRDGEPAVVAGEITTNDQYSMSGIPGIASLPGLNQALLDNNRVKENDELLIMITPHVVANNKRDTEEIWVTAK
jgi:type II secretory pathway component GspD/PulD (secretin)